MGGEEGRRHVVTMTDKQDLLLQTRPGDEVDQLLPVSRLSWGIAGEHDHGAVERPLAVELCRRLDRMAVAFEPGEPCGMQHDLGLGFDAPALSELGDRARRHDQGIESGIVDAAINDADALPRHVLAFGDQLRRVERVSDHPVAAPHHAVIRGLDGTETAIGAVIGGNEGAAGAARGEERAPAGRPAPRVNEIDASLVDESFEALGIGENGERILARDGENDDLSSRARDRRRHAAARGGDQGRGTGARECFGDLDGRLLASSGIEARHDLQYGDLCHFR